jgi:hypothetical protein
MQDILFWCNLLTSPTVSNHLCSFRQVYGDGAKFNSKTRLRIRLLRVAWRKREKKKETKLDKKMRQDLRGGVRPAVVCALLATAVLVLTLLLFLRPSEPRARSPDFKASSAAEDVLVEYHQPTDHADTPAAVIGVDTDRLRPFVSEANRQYLRSFCVGCEQRRIDYDCCRLLQHSGQHLSAAIGLIVAVTDRDRNISNAMLITIGGGQRTALRYNASLIGVVGNESFVSAPEWVVSPSWPLAAHSESRSKRKILGDSGDRPSLMMRVTADGTVDRNALLLLPMSVVTSLWGPSVSAQLLPLSALDGDLKAQFDQDHDCRVTDRQLQRAGYPTPRLSLHVVLFLKSLHELERKLRRLKAMAGNAVGYQMQVDMFVHVNAAPSSTASHRDASGSPFLGVVARRVTEELGPHCTLPGATSASASGFLRLVIVPHLLTEHPYFLTWKPRALISSQKQIYDLVINSEDDMEILRSHVVDYYCKYKRAAAAAGVHLGFLRYEKGGPSKGGGRGGGSRRILSDVLRGQFVGRTKDLFYLAPSSLAAGQGSSHPAPHKKLFVRVKIQVYYAFWIADRRDVLELVSHRHFMIDDTRSAAYPLIREDASCLKGPMMLPRYNFSHAMPVADAGKTIDAACMVWHMSNSYIGKGMAKLDLATRIAQ